MIRLIQKEDFKTVCKIINDNWISVYKGYINQNLINDNGCKQREERLIKDFSTNRLFNYVYELKGKVIGILSIGDTADSDKKGAFELWRIYIEKAYQNKGIGSELIKFAQNEAVRLKYKEMVIWAFKENKRAVSFYKKHGFIVDKEEYLGEKLSAFGIRFNKKIV